MIPENQTILVVEDDDLLRKVIIDQLTIKYPAIPARDGKEALELATSHKPGIIILDLLMPKLDGFGFLKQLRNSPDPDLAQTAILVVSNLSDPSSIEMTKQYGVLEYYIKSDIQAGLLLNRVTRYFTQGT